MDIKVIKPSFQILDAHMKPEQRIAMMARLCYRTEDKASPEADAKLIRGCIDRTHYSVTEHGFISAIFSQARIDPERIKKLAPDMDAKLKITSDAIWNNFNSDTRRKYMEVFGDDEIYKIIDGTNSKPSTYNVYAGNVHTWLSLIDEFMSASVQKQFHLGFVFVLALVDKLHKAFPNAFQVCIDQIQEALAAVDSKHPLYKVAAGDAQDVKVNIDCFRQYFDMFEMIVTPSCARMTLSAIIRTDRAVTHELVRHRRGVAYSQESQRYVNYGNRGYEVIWPAMDPVKYAGATFPSTPYIPDGKTETQIDQLELEQDGFIPRKSSAFNTWYAAMELAVNHYELMMSSKLKKAIYQTDDTGAYVYSADGKPVVKEIVDLVIPPETARAVLPNSFATTIGVTWTPSTFVNLVWRRVEKSAQWPIRSMIGNIVLQGLKDGHPFFENFPPKLVTKWINDIFSMGISTDEDLKKTLIEAQDKRQQNIAKAIQEEMDRVAAARAEAAKAAAKAKGEGASPKTPEAPTTAPAEK